MQLLSKDLKITQLSLQELLHLMMSCNGSSGFLPKEYSLIIKSDRYFRHLSPTKVVCYNKWYYLYMYIFIYA